MHAFNSRITFFSLLMLATAITDASEVPLNHFFTVLDTNTYKAIEDSEFVTREFAPHEYRATVRNDRSYAGIYFHGENTYFELFDEATRGPDSRGFSMLAMGVDSSGELAAIHEQQPAVFRPEIRQIHRREQELEIPWFTSAGANVSRGPHKMSFGSWVMEYSPEFLNQWRVPEDQADMVTAGVTRAAILERYVSVLPSAPKAPYFRDITGLTIALYPTSLADTARYLIALGYSEVQDGSSGSIRCRPLLSAPGSPT